MPGERDEVRAERGDVDGDVRHRLRAVQQHQRTDLPGPGDEDVDGVDGAEQVGVVHHRDELRALVDELVELRQVEPALVGEAEPAQRRAGALGEQLPRHDVGVVLHLGDDDLVTGAEAQARVLRHGGERVRDEVDRLGRVLGEHDLGGGARPDERRDLLAGALERLGGLGAERVHGPGDVGVVQLVVLPDRVDHLARLLRRVPGVEVDERVAVDLPVQDREVLAYRVNIQRVHNSPMRGSRAPRRPGSARSLRPRAARPAPGRLPRRCVHRRTRGPDRA